MVLTLRLLAMLQAGTVWRSLSNLNRGGAIPLLFDEVFYGK
jgi:hypothetical protein